MGYIYKLAEKVIIWLGPEANDTTGAIYALSTLSSRIEVDWGHYTISLAHTHDVGPDRVDLNLCAPFDDDCYMSIVTLLNRPWFHRLWIRQEVYLAGDRAGLVCGFEIMPWLTFRTVVVCLFRRRNLTKFPGFVPAVTRAWYIISLSREPSQNYLGAD